MVRFRTYFEGKIGRIYWWEKSELGKNLWSLTWVIETVKLRKVWFCEWGTPLEGSQQFILNMTEETAISKWRYQIIHWICICVLAGICVDLGVNRWLIALWNHVGQAAGSAVKSLPGVFIYHSAWFSVPCKCVPWEAAEDGLRDLGLCPSLVRPDWVVGSWH